MNTTMKLANLVEQNGIAHVNKTQLSETSPFTSDMLANK